MTFDNEMELHKIKEYHPSAKIVLRIITNDADAVCRFSMKFGADMNSSFKLIELARHLDLDLVGISFHVGSGQMSPSAFSESIGNARRLFDYAREHHGYRMHLLDLGGGYPGTPDMADLFAAIAKEINRSLDVHFGASDMAEWCSGKEDKFRVIAEPGRYYAASAFTLAVSVISRRDMNQTELQREQEREALLSKPEVSVDSVDTSKSIMYYINDGVYASFNCLFYDHADMSPTLLGNQNSVSSIAI